MANSTSKFSPRTRKMAGEFGLKRLEQRRSGLGKVMAILARGTRVDASPILVERCAAMYNL